MTPFTRDNYYQEKFSGLSLTEETVKGTVFEECSFEDCSFITCTFERLRFINCKLANCILSAVVPMNSRFDDVSFTSCKVIGIDWTRTTEVRELHFKQCQLNYSNFRFLKIPGLKMIECEVKDADFIETKLKGAIFRKSDLKNTIFFKTDLTNADFKDALNYAIDPGTNILKKTKFSLPEALSLLENFDIIIE